MIKLLRNNSKCILLFMFLFTVYFLVYRLTQMAASEWLYRPINNSQMILINIFYALILFCCRPIRTRRWGLYCVSGPPFLFFNSQSPFYPAWQVVKTKLNRFNHNKIQILSFLLGIKGSLKGKKQWKMHFTKFCFFL
jgi:hypothetical protein